MASIVNSKLYYAMLQIAKSENIGSRLQFASIAGCRTRSVEIYRVVFAWCKLLPILHFRLFLVAIDSAVSLGHIKKNSWLASLAFDKKWAGGRFFF